MPKLTLHVALISFFFVPALAFRGVVVAPDGRPVADAWVSILGSNAAATTDREGRFSFPDSVPPFQLEIVHPSFELTVIDVEGPSSNDPFQILIEPRSSLIEELTVLDGFPRSEDAPVGVTATRLNPTEAPVPSSTLTELVNSVPAVAETGQGGIFQVYSIRGISRHRVQTSVSGMRITSERRAGASASFLDPLLMESVDVLRGPASTYYGSGALGGVVEIMPRHFDGWNFRSGFETQGRGNFQLAGWGNDEWSLGVVRRNAGNAFSPDGGELNSHFSQISAILIRDWLSDRRIFRLLVIPSVGRDIGKASTDFPGQVTTYPVERHLMVRFSMDTVDRWHFSGYLHPHNVHTLDVEPDLETDVYNRTFDLGFKFGRQLSLAAADFRLGVDYFGRRNVAALEHRRRTSGDGSAETLRSLRDGREDELSFLASIKLPVNRIVFESGTRLSLLQQRNAGEAGAGYAALNGFAGALVPLGRGLELTGNVGSGLRFPSLSERFFTGTTGRGRVIGNPDLDTERSMNLEAGVRWYREKVLLAGYMFQNRIDRYIERVEPSIDLLTFVNLGAGTIRGLEFEAIVTPRERWQVYALGHLISGSDRQNRPLADIPADRIGLGLRYRFEGWRYGAEWQFRSKKSRFGSGEKPIPSAGLLSAFLEMPLQTGWALYLSSSNLTSEAYFNSADRKVPMAQGRSISFQIQWTPD